MKLFLTSYRIPVPGALFDLVGKPASDLKLAFISNASDYYIEKARMIKTQERVKFFQDFDIKTVDEFDLRKFTNPETLKNTLSAYDVVWVNGGNTFMLMEAMHNAGFEAVIRELLGQGIVYGGESAGAIVAGTSLKGIELADEPEFANETIWKGLGLVDSFIMPHVDNPQYQDKVEPAVAIHRGEKVTLLKDSQVLIIDGYKVDILSGDTHEG